MDLLEKGSALEQTIDNFRIPRYAELPDLDFYMDQVVALTEKHLYLLSYEGGQKFITPSMINNYVKLGIIPAPKKKRYSKEHICYLFIICTLKSVIPIQSIADLIKMQTRNKSIFELYDLFCEAFENMLKQANLVYGEIISETADPEDALAKLSLFMAIHSGTTRLIATNALAATNQTEEPFDSKDKKNEQH
ncbi:MAG: DUF1836 domain-containing protein [Clostridia bacterium]|nr:DUF1836 domain-containing protein [Clostridia bacterium]